MLQLRIREHLKVIAMREYVLYLPDLDISDLSIRDSFSSIIRTHYWGGEPEGGVTPLQGMKLAYSVDHRQVGFSLIIFITFFFFFFKFYNPNVCSLHSDVNGNDMTADSTAPTADL